MNGRIWTADDSAKLRHLAQAGMNDAEIGRILGRDRTCIVRKRAQMGIERGMSVAHIAALARCNARRRAMQAAAAA